MRPSNHPLPWPVRTPDDHALWHAQARQQARRLRTAAHKAMLAAVARRWVAGVKAVQAGVQALLTHAPRSQ